MGDDKQEEVQTLDEWKTLLTKDLLALKQLDRQDAFTRMRRSMKEQEIGQHCYQAGESLGDPDLALLKETLGLDEWQWHVYTSKVRPEHDEADTPTSGSPFMQDPRDGQRDYNKRAMLSKSPLQALSVLSLSWLSISWKFHFIVENANARRTV